MDPRENNTGEQLLKTLSALGNEKTAVTTTAPIVLGNF